MKKLFMLFALIFTTPLFASGIGANETSASCDNATLEAYSGTVNVEIDWIPNTIETRWYNGNTLVDTTNTNANSCEYGDVLNRPTNPTRTGYTFTGWTVQPEMDFATIPNVGGTDRWATGEDSNHNYYCWHGKGVSVAREDCNLSTYNDLALNEWKVQTNYGTVYGAGYCSAKSGDNSGYSWLNDPSNWRSTFDELENASGNKIYCWCQATGYIPNNNNPNNIQYRPSNKTYWIYCNPFVCPDSCASYCANYVLGNAVSEFRMSLYGAR